MHHPRETLIEYIMDQISQSDPLIGCPYAV